MRRHLLVVSVKKIKMLKTPLQMQKVKYYRWGHNNFLPQPTYITNIYVYNKGLLSSILWTCAPMLRTDDATRQTMDARHRTMDTGRRTLSTIL